MVAIVVWMYSVSSVFFGESSAFVHECRVIINVFDLVGFSVCFDHLVEAFDIFCEALHNVTAYLCRMIAADGEGATKFIECKVNGAKDENDAILASKSVISSSLVKSAIFGGDPNWGRIVAAVGYSGCEMNQDMISVSVNSDDGQEAILVDKGKILAFEGTDELKKEIQEYVKTHTAPYKYPRIVEFVDELPKTISGKVRRVEIRKNDLEKLNK